MRIQAGIALQLLTICALLHGRSVCAQQVAEEAQAVRDPRGPSADGNYWFEVEVTIFGSVYGSGGRSEVPVPSNTLRYLNPLQRLQLQSDSYAYPFDSDEGKAWLAATSPAASDGPTFSPADSRAFKILDSERDPFIALDRRASRFNQLNARLQSGGDHTLLWHQVWRQPLRPRSQAPALQIEAGKLFGDHYQLEGSLRVSGQGNAAMLDANLWSGSFKQDRNAIAGEWKLPPRPQPLQPLNVAVNGAEPMEQWFPYDVWQLNQSRDLGPNALYYLDHPALGLLIEIRPYLVPESRVPASVSGTPRPATRTGFE